MNPLGRRLLVALGATSFSFSIFLSAQDPLPVALPELGAPSVIPHDGIPDILTGTASLAARARLFSGAPGHAPLALGTSFGEAFPGGIRVAAGDVTGDGVADAVVAMGPGVIAGAGGVPVGGLVKIYNGFDASLIGEGFPFGPGSTGGIFVAMGDINNDGRDDLIASEGAGAHVRVYSLSAAGALLSDLTPYGATFTGGVRVAAGDVTGDGRADVVTAPASGVGTIKVFAGGTTPAGELFPFGAAFLGGVFVAAGDVTGDGRADLIASTSSGPGHLRVFNAVDGAPVYDIPLPAAGVSVAAADLTADGRAEIIGGIGPGGPPLVGILDGATGALLASFAAEASAFGGGVFVATAPNQGIAFTSDDETTFTTGTAGTFTVTTVAAPAVTTITQTGTLPMGVTFTDNGDGTATLSGTVPVGSGGTFTLTFTASNGVAAPAQQTFTLRVHGPPQITSANATTFNVGAAGTFAVTTTGVPAPALTIAGALPAGVTFTDNSDGTATVAGTPQVGSGGTYPLTITATNGVGSAATQPFTLTVDASPGFTSADTTTFLVGTAGSFAITATAEPAITTIALAGALPAGVAFMDNGGGTATLSGTPAPTSGGSYPLTLTASNGVAADAVQAFTLTVQQAPAITSANNATFIAGVASSFAVTAIGSPTPSVVQAGPLPAGIVFNAVTHMLEGTSTEMGTFSAIQFTASNGVGVDAVQAFTLNVICPAITVTSTPATVPDGVFNVPYAGAAFQQTGGGSGGTWSSSGPLGGLTLDPSTGALSGTPNTTGIFNATITYTNAGNCQGSTNVSISIAPSAVADSYNAGIGNTQLVAAGHSAPGTPFVAFVSSVLGNDGGPVGTLAVMPVTNAPTTAGGQITIDVNGAFTYTPQAGDIGVDSYLYTVTSNGVSAQAAITLGLGTERVWYVNAGAPGPGSGTSNAPFKTLANLNGAGGSGDVDDAGDYIYLRTGDYASGFEAEVGQTLWGAGAVFNPVAGLVILPESPPTLQGTVNIAADNVTISSLLINTNGAPGMTNSGTQTGLTVKNGVTVATFNAPALLFQNLNSTAGGAPNFGLNFLTVTAGLTAKGISLTNVNTSSGSFVITGADGGDPDTIPEAGTGGLIHTITARGVELIDVGGLVSLNAMSFLHAGTTDGAPSTECGSPLTGNNTLCNAAIHLVNVGAGGSVVLSGVSVSNGTQVGINGNGVTNLIMDRVVVENVGTDSHESGVMLQNLSGVGSITNSHFHNNSARQFHLANSGGTLAFTITGSTFENSFAPNGSQGLLIEGYGPATNMTVHANAGNTFSNLSSNAWLVAAATNATVTASLSSSMVTNTNGIAVHAASNSRVTTFIQGNTFTAGANTQTDVISLETNDGGRMVGIVTGNTVGQAGVDESGTACVGCNGIFINPRNAGAFDLLVAGNTIQKVNGSGVLLLAGEAETQGVNATITGNLIRDPGPFANLNSSAIEVTNGVTSGPPADGGCLAMTLGGIVNPGTWPSGLPDAMNQILGAWNGDVLLERAFDTTINLPGLSGSESTWVADRNSFDSAPAVTANGTPFGSAAACQQ